MTIPIQHDYDDEISPAQIDAIRTLAAAGPPTCETCIHADLTAMKCIRECTQQWQRSRANSLSFERSQRQWSEMRRRAPERCGLTGKFWEPHQ